MLAILAESHLMPPKRPPRAGRGRGARYMWGVGTAPAGRRLVGRLVSASDTSDAGVRTRRSSSPRGPHEAGGQPAPEPQGSRGGDRPSGGRDVGSAAGLRRGKARVRPARLFVPSPLRLLWTRVRPQSERRHLLWAPARGARRRDRRRRCARRPVGDCRCRSHWCPRLTRTRPGAGLTLALSF